jgi:enoyl-CoA hydratase/carnithine racemase
LADSQPRGQIVLFGINRPYIQNRTNPDAFEKLAEAYYQYDHDPSLRAAILFGHGENFSKGSTLKDLGRSQVRASPGSRALTERVAFLMRDLVIFAASFYSLNQDVVGASVFAIHPQEQERRAA